LDADGHGEARILPIPKVVQTAETQRAQRFWEGVGRDADERGGARVLSTPEIVQTAETQSAQRFWKGGKHWLFDWTRMDTERRGFTHTKNSSNHRDTESAECCEGWVGAYPSTPAGLPQGERGNYISQTLLEGIV
jgi:purine nucleoside permease